MNWPKGFKTGLFAPRPLVLLVVLVCAGTAVSVGAFLVLRASERNRQQAALKQYAAERFGAIQKVSNEDLLALELLGRFYAGSEKVERAEFHEFARPIPKHLSCLKALEWVPRVKDADRAAYEEAVRQEGFPAFQITERDPDSRTVRAARRAEYFPVDFIEPAEGNELARGFDLASNAVRREAMEQARDTGAMRGTAPIRLVQETGNQAGFLVLLPVYRNGTSPESVEDRQANLEGFVLGVFRIGDLVERALAPLAPKGIDVALYDMSAPAGRRLLAWLPSRLRGKSPKAPDEANVRLSETLHYAASLRPAGRTWLVLCTPSPEFFTATGRWYPWEALGIGLAFTALLAAYLGMTSRRTAQIERLAGRLLESNEKLEAEVRERQRAEEALEGAKQKAETARWCAESIGAVTAEVSQHMKPREIAEVVVRHTGEALHTPRCSMVLRTDDADGVEVVALYRDGKPAPFGHKGPMTLAEHPHIAEAMRERQTVVVRSQERHELALRGQVAVDKPWYYIMVPIATGEDVFGTVNIAVVDPQTTYDDQDLLMVETICRHAAQALKNASMVDDLEHAHAEMEEANRRLEELATTDPVTGLVNRRRFMEVLEAEFQRSRRYGGRLALAMVDVDRFKSFNDAHGHAFGDRVLVETAKRLAAGARQTDVVARLGGDEFVILMPETSADEAVQAAERIWKAVSQDPISDGKRSVSATISVGIGTVENGKAGSPESLLKQADDAMYAAKETGRNRVCLAPLGKAVSPAR